MKNKLWNEVLPLLRLRSTTLQTRLIAHAAFYCFVVANSMSISSLYWYYWPFLHFLYLSFDLDFI